VNIVIMRDGTILSELDRQTRERRDETRDGSEGMSKVERNSPRQTDRPPDLDRTLAEVAIL
jgi:hypothetical protein